MELIKNIDFCNLIFVYNDKINNYTVNKSIELKSN